MTALELSFCLHAFIPAIADHLSAKMKHEFGVWFPPIHRVAFQSQVDHSSNAAFDGTASQGNSQSAKMRVFIILSLFKLSSGNSHLIIFVVLINVCNAAKEFILIYECFMWENQYNSIQMIDDAV